MRRAAVALAILAACTAPPGDVAITKTKPRPDTRTNPWAAQPTTTTSTTTTTEAPVRVKAAAQTPRVNAAPIPYNDEGWQVAEASWYGPGFYGNSTACAQTYTREIVGVAHRSLPCGTQVVFRHAGRTVTAPVIDRGPYIAGRTWDLSHGLCQALAHCHTGPIEWRMP